MIVKEYLDHEPEDVTINKLPDGGALIYLRKDIKQSDKTDENENPGYECLLAVCKVSDDVANSETEESILENFDIWFDYVSMVSEYSKHNTPVTEVGTYTGTGTFGKDNPNVLVFKSEPSSLLVFKDNALMLSFGNFKDFDFDSNYSANGNVVCWYYDSAKEQCNEAGKMYMYVKM